MKRKKNPLIQLMSISRQTLFILALILWLFGGYKVLLIGWEAWISDVSNLKYIWLVLALLFFMGFVFPKAVRANSQFILGLKGERFPWYKCLKPTSWGIMIFMISLGVALRHFHLVPNSFIAGFYTGLGLSLSLVALFFYGREIIKLQKEKNR